MTRHTADRWHAATGLASVAAGAAAVLFESGPVRPTDPAATISAYYVDHRDALLAQSLLFLLGSAFLAWFVAVLAEQIRRAGDDLRVLALVVLGAGEVSVTLEVAAVAVQAGLATAGRESGDPALVGAMDVLFVVAGIPMAVMLLAVALSVLGHRAFPDWLAWLSSATALTQLVPVVGLAVTTGPLASGGWASAYLPYPLYVGWLVATSVLLVRSPRPLPRREPGLVPGGGGS